MSKVALMCGHGRSTDGTWDCGTSYGGNNEAALMLPITKAAVKYLRSYGVTVISDADTNNNKNMIVDVGWANKELATIYVSIHCDYYKSPSGTLPLFVSAKGRTLAAAINNAVVSGMGMKTRGVTKRTDLYELNYTNMPACIFETGSIKADISKLKNDPDKYGKCIAKGICDYLGVKAEAPTATAPKPSTPTVSDGKLSVDGKGGKKTVKRLQEFLGCSTKDGIISGQTKSLIYSYAPALSAVEYGTGGSPTVKRLQKWVGSTQDGVWGKNTTLALQKKLGVTADGIAGLNTFKALQTWLNTHDKADYPAPKPTPTPTPTTNASKIVAKAKDYAWAYGTAKKKYAYKTGSAKASYKTALKKFLGKSNKISQSDCGYFVSTCVRASGVSSSFLALKGTKEAFPSVPSTMKIVHKGKKIPDGLLQAGDIIRYKKTSGQHALMYYGNGKIAEAGRGHQFPAIEKDTKKYNKSNVKFSTLQVIRAK